MLTAKRPIYDTCRCPGPSSIHRNWFRRLPTRRTGNKRTKQLRRHFENKQLIFHSASSVNQMSMKWCDEWNVKLLPWTRCRWPHVAHVVGAEQRHFRAKVFKSVDSFPSSQWMMFDIWRSREKLVTWNLFRYCRLGRRHFQRFIADNCSLLSIK